MTDTPLTDAVTQAVRSPDASAALSEMTRRLVAREQARQRRQARMRRAEHVISVAVDAVFVTLVFAGIAFVFAVYLAGMYESMGGQHGGRVFVLSFVGVALLLFPRWRKYVRLP